MGYRGRSYHAWLLGSAAAIAVSSAASAADNAQFDIAPQPLASALNEFSLQSHQSVLFTTDLAAAKSSQGVSGQVQVADALSSLLAGTGLSWKKQGDTFLIVSASDPQSGSAAGDGADAGTVQALVVTAQKREENIQDVPIAMSAFTQEDLTRSQVAGGPDLMTQVPNFTFTKTNFTGYSIQIRGIGTQAISATTDAAVAVAFNNTPFIRNRFFEQEFYDLERVEVLRGPQGTLYGRNATAGVVNIISAKANPRHFEAKLSADVSNYSSSRFEGMLNLPLVEDKVALRIAGAWTKREGFVKNILTGQQTDGRDLWSARLSLGLTPTDKFKANLIYEHFSENDDRLRSGKQLCRKDLGPPGFEPGTGYPLATIYSQGCVPASLYSPDSFQTPHGYSIPYYSPLGFGYDSNRDPYLSQFQSRNLREIETHIKPEYQATADVVELQAQYDLTDSLTIASETGFSRDFIFSFEDYNRFDTTPGVLGDNTNVGSAGWPVRPDGVFCDPQLGCTDRLAAGDLATAKSQQFSQEVRLSSNYDGPLNFSLGANFLRYDTEDKYYVFINTLSIAALQSYGSKGVLSDNSQCFQGDPNLQGSDLVGYAWSDTARVYNIGGCTFVDVNDIHHLNDEGRNYFLSKNPYHLLSYAAFGEIYYQLTPTLKLTGGFRWTDDRKQAPQIPSWVLASGAYGLPTRKTINQEWNKPTGRLAIDWKPELSFTDDTLLYASYVRGYKAGGANPPPAVIIRGPVSCDGCGYNPGALVTESLTHPATFEPEFVDAYEIGTKNTLLDGRLTLNLNAFYYDYRGYQISEIVDRAAINFNFDSKVWGSELELDWRPLENLRLGFKGGYENTRVADGSQAIDLMDRTAGTPGWLVRRPFPTEPSNCIVPVEHANDNLFACEAYTIGQSQWDAPNNGEGFTKDLSGNALPNAPKFTATITADYTLPLPNSWLMTLHTDLYYQSEAWTRIFNDPGYDKLKAYNNVNVAAIFSNDDAGWQVMAYVKNLMDKDNITGSFLNSDDTGLTTNVFLSEPRLYGLRVTKTWDGSSWWSAHAHSGAAHYPFHLEVEGDYGRISGGREVLAPAMIQLFPADHPFPIGVQNDLDWAGAGGMKITYQPQQTAWRLGAGVRYGRARGDAEAHPKWGVSGGYRWSEASIAEALARYPGLGPNTLHFMRTSRIDPQALNAYDYATTTSGNSESFAMADFTLGKDVGLGLASKRLSTAINFGVRYADFDSDSSVVLHGRPDLYFPADDISIDGGHMHRVHGTMEAHRMFKGAGPVFSWDGSVTLGASDVGRVTLDGGVEGTVLFGRQTTNVKGEVRGGYDVQIFSKYIPLLGLYGRRHTEGAYETPIESRRTRNATVPGVGVSLGLSYSVDAVKISGGYRLERYFNAIDAGILTSKRYDRNFDGPYFKVSVGFGG